MDGWEQGMEDALSRLGVPGPGPTAPEAPPAVTTRSALKDPATLRYLRTRQWIQALLTRARGSETESAPPLNLARVLGSLPGREQVAAAPPPQVRPPLAAPTSAI